MVDFGQDPVYVNTKNCVQIAGRDIDEMERIRMREHGITVFPSPTSTEWECPK